MLNSNKKIFEKALEVNADIYHFHDPELLPLGNKLKKLGKSVIFDSHENYTIQINGKDYIPAILRKIISKLYFYYETYSIRKYDAVIFPCTYNSQDPFENRAVRTVFIDNFPMLEELYHIFDESTHKEKDAICYVGTLTEDRGITNIMEAAHKAEVKLVLGGIFTSESYEQEVNNRSEFSCVDYRGYLNRKEVLEIYRKCQIGLSTLLNVGQYNKGDHFPTKVYEYMAMGLPVILTDSKHVREVLKTYEIGIPVNPDDPKEISEAILYLLKNPELAKKMGKDGRLAIKEKFNWGIEEQKLISLYESL
ncbi:hypothetical protein C1N55_07285 [Lysinibacillus sp. SGAir0095]|nr:hypothetical protein C1N55_07285 [Lysinibacillus sp. SGAir0095]